MSKHLTITISGTAGTGKSTIAQELHGYLRFRGFTCYNLDEDGDRSNLAHIGAMSSIKDSGTSISINTKQTLRSNVNNEKNYMVLIDGRHAYYADTIKEVWAVINERDVGYKFNVYSPTGQDVSDFVESRK